MQNHKRDNQTNPESVISELLSTGDYLFILEHLQIMALSFHGIDVNRDEKTTDGINKTYKALKHFLSKIRYLHDDLCISESINEKNPIDTGIQSDYKPSKDRAA